MFEIGQWVDNQYFVLEKYTSRRWIVYIGLDRISENVFVIKTPSITFPNFSAEHFERKAKSWISLGHCDEIASAFMLKDFDGAPHLFIEYIDGPSLADIICSRPGKPLPIDQTISLMKEIISGMKSLHGANLRIGGSLVHGNLCPHNILTEAGNIKITNVGLSGAFSMPHGAANADLFLRDMPCIAPEQIEHPEKEGPLADIYSFGAVMYEVATGTTPTVLKTPDDPHADFTVSNPVAPRARNRHCPRWLDEAILKCMAKDPSNRFQSFEQIAAYVDSMGGSPEGSRVSGEEEKRSGRTSRVARARGLAKKVSSRLDHYYLGVEHMMLGILSEEEALVLSAIEDKATAEKLRAEIVSNIPKGEGPWQWDGIIKTPRYRRVMKVARKIRREYSDDRMLPQHILLAILLEGQNAAVRALRELGVDIGAAVKRLRKELGRRRPSIMVTNFSAPSVSFTHKISCVAAGPYFIPFLGRGPELDMARELLLAEKKGIIVIGEPGVGKTAFTQQLSCVLSDATAQAGIEYGSLLKLRTAALMASDEDGEKVIDNFVGILNEVTDSDSILLIENLPMMLGIDVRIPPKTAALEIEDAVSAHGMLLVATATPADYAQCENEHEGILRFLEAINLSEPSEDETLAILDGAKQAFEVEHSVTIADDAPAAALPACAGSQQARALPGRAIELLDRACAAARMDSARGGKSGAPAAVTAEQIERLMDETLMAGDTGKTTNPEAYI